MILNVSPQNSPSLSSSSPTFNSSTSPIYLPHRILDHLEITNLTHYDHISPHFYVDSNSNDHNIGPSTSPRLDSYTPTLQHPPTTYLTKLPLLDQKANQKNRAIKKMAISSFKENTNSSSRSRFGCTQCKKKRIKCDELKPHCSVCQTKGISCTYQVTLQFREDLENLGKRFGREGVWSKEPGSSKNTSTQLVNKSKDSFYLTIQNTHKPMFINFQYNDLNRRNDLKIHPCLQSSIIPNDINSTYDHSSLNYAINYYIDFISPIFNPFGNNFHSSLFVSQFLEDHSIIIEKGLDLPSLIQYSQSNNHVFYLMLALGSIYLSKSKDGVQGDQWLSKSKCFQRKGVEMIADTVEYLRNYTNTQFENSSRLLTTDLLLSLVLLIMYEIANDCSSNWNFYLKICKTLVSSNQFIQPINLLENSLLRFCLEFLNYMESMGRTACKDSNSFFLPPEDEEETGDSQILNNSMNVSKRSKSLISWMGCDKNLVNVISDITDLSLERSLNGITEDNYMILCTDIERRLSVMRLDINIDEFLFDLGFDLEKIDTNSTVAESQLLYVKNNIDVEEFCFLLSCEVKRSAASIYLSCCLLNEDPESKIIQKKIDETFKMLKFIILQHDFRWCSTLLWSLFVVSVEISVFRNDCDALRYLTLELLEKLEKNSLGNVNQTRDVILGIWKARDLSNSDENSTGNLKKPKSVVTRSRKASRSGTDKRNGNVSLLGYINDWENYVADKSYTLSLA